MDKIAQALVALAIVGAYLFVMGILGHLFWYCLHTGWNLIG